jgi:GNAT superfamily N-acetyltransferase
VLQASVLPYRSDDLGELHRMICTTIDQSYSGTYSQEAIEFFKAYHSKENIRADALSGHTILVRENDGLIGTGTLLGTNIRRVFVIPYSQGMGIGTMIMAELERLAEEDRLDIVDLDSSMVSVDFYHHLGYKDENRAFLALEKGGRLDYVPMIKMIGRR